MASGSIGSLIIEMGIDLARLSKDVSDAKRTVGGALSDIQASASKLAGFLGVSLGAGAFVGMIKGAIDTEVQLGRLAQRAGESVEVFSALAFAFKKTGDIDADTLESALKKLDKTIGEAAAGGKQASGEFAALGVEFKDKFTGEVRKGSDVLLDLAKVFAEAPDGPVKTAYAMKLMGKAGDELIPSLNKGRDALEDLMTKARDTGRVLGEEAFQQAEKFKRELDELQSGGARLARSLADDLVPALNRVTKAMNEGKQEAGFWGGIVQGLGRYMFEALGGLDDPVQNAARDVVDLTEDLANLEKHLGGLSSSVNPGVKRQLENQIAAKKAELDQAMKLFQQLQKGASDDAAAKPAAAAKSPLDPSGLTKASEAEAELKKFTSSLQGLEKQYFSMTHAGEVALVMWETEKGSLRGLTDEHKEALLTFAGQIDARNLLVERQQVYVQSWENEVAAVEKGRAAMADMAIARKDEIADLKFQSSLVGVSALDQERMIALRKIDLDLRQRLRALPDDDSAATATAAADMIAQAETQKATVNKMIGDRQAAERSWLTGVKEGMNEYVDMATNAAANAKMVFTNTFRSMEDALVNFVMTGKLDFKSLADSIISDMVRINIRQNITGPLAAAAGGLFSGAVDSGPEQLSGPGMEGRASGGGVSAGTSYLVGEQGPEIFTPGSSGSITPNGALGGGDMNVVINAPGADSAALARVQAELRGLRSSFDGMAVAAVRTHLARYGSSMA